MPVDRLLDVTSPASEGIMRDSSTPRTAIGRWRRRTDSGAVICQPGDARCGRFIETRLDTAGLSAEFLPLSGIAKYLQSADFLLGYAALPRAAAEVAEIAGQ
jgi:hypothetical protein